MEAVQSCQKSYVDTRRRDLSFGKGDWVYLKVLPMRGIKWFGKKGKLSPRYVDHFQIVEKVGPCCLQGCVTKIFWGGARPVSCILIEEKFHAAGATTSRPG